MIHAYDEVFLPVIQEKVAIIFEIAILFEKIEIDKFMNIFMKSNIVKRLEVGDSVISLGKSANELLALIIGSEPKDYDLPFSATPEYWVGYVVSYIQWFYNVPYEKIYDAYGKEVVTNADSFTLCQTDIRITDTKFETKTTTFIKDAFRRFCKNKSSVVAAFILGILSIIFRHRAIM